MINENSVEQKYPLSLSSVAVVGLQWMSSIFMVDSKVCWLTSRDMENGDITLLLASKIALVVEFS